MIRSIVSCDACSAEVPLQGPRPGEDPCYAAPTHRLPGWSRVQVEIDAPGASPGDPPGERGLLSFLGGAPRHGGDHVHLDLCPACTACPDLSLVALAQARLTPAPAPADPGPAPRFRSARL